MIGGEWISRRSYTKDSFKDLKKSDDLISRQAAIEALENAGMTNYQATGDFYGIINALTVIKNMPTVEPRRGEWMLMSDCDGEFCSLCGREGYSGMSYCPNCGADMRGDKDD